MIIVTGGAGFIGSNLIRTLNQRGSTDILVVDNLTRGIKCRNLRSLEIADFMDKRTFRRHLDEGTLASALPRRTEITTIFHQGACTDTTVDNGRYLMANNYQDAKRLLHYAVTRGIPLVYASSAAVYGNTPHPAVENSRQELPLNPYGYAKWLFDQYAAKYHATATATVVGLRYFNVYGPGETHKGTMASMVYQGFQQLHHHATLRLFEGSGGYDHGEQRRDFIHVDDVVQVNLFFASSPSPRFGVFNVGTGHSCSFNQMANQLIHHLGQGSIAYRPMPASLQDRYQHFTEADLTRLRAAGYTPPMMTPEQGIPRAVATWMAEAQAP